MSPSENSQVIRPASAASTVPPGGGPGAVNPSALTADEAAALLRLEAATVRGHIAAGLPTDATGRVHLVEYVAWMLLRLSALAGGTDGEQ